jgi:hypothetical protein
LCCEASSSCVCDDDHTTHTGQLFFDGALAANGGLLLHRLLGRFLYVATLPNPIVTAVTKAMIPDFETEAVTLYRIPYWPYWLPVLQFLYNHRTEVIQLAPQHVAEIAGTWLQRGHESWLLRQEAAELALTLAEQILHLEQSGGFVYIEDKLVKSAYRAALAAAHEFPERVAAFALKACARQEQPIEASQNEENAEPIRHWPGWSAWACRCRFSGHMPPREHAPFAYHDCPKCCSGSTLRRLAKITWPFLQAMCDDQPYAEPNNRGHRSEVYHPEAALG